MVDTAVLVDYQEGSRHRDDPGELAGKARHQRDGVQVGQDRVCARLFGCHTGTIGRRRANTPAGRCRSAGGGGGRE